VSHEPLLVAFGAAVRTLRSVHGWTQEAFASQAGTTQAQISALESGKGNPTLLMVERLANALEVPLIKLVSETVRQQDLRRTRSDYTDASSPGSAEEES
jgi:transcriptional regulator with XRE-family HTH domain